MEPLLGNDLRSKWQECEPAIGRKIAASYDISANDIRRCVAFITSLSPPSAPESRFFLTLGTPAQQQCPPLNSTLAQRTKEEWARTLCENKAVAIIPVAAQVCTGGIDWMVGCFCQEKKNPTNARGQASPHSEGMRGNPNCYSTGPTAERSSASGRKSRTFL